MILLLFVFGLSLVFGFYFLAAGVLRLPSMGAARAIAERGSGKQKVTGFLEDGMDHLSVLLARHITLDEYRKRRMGNILKAAGMGMTPGGSCRLLYSQGRCDSNPHSAMFTVPASCDTSTGFCSGGCLFQRIQKAGREIEGKTG